MHSASFKTISVNIRFYDISLYTFQISFLYLKLLCLVIYLLLRKVAKRFNIYFNRFSDQRFKFIALFFDYYVIFQVSRFLKKKNVFDSLISPKKLLVSMQNKIFQLRQEKTNLQQFSYIDKIFESSLLLIQKKNYRQTHKMDHMLFARFIKSIF